MIKRYEDLTMTDDFMFCKLLQNSPDISQELVELVTGKKIGGIVTADKQHPIEITSDGRGVRLDVYLKDDKDTVYNIEMQTVKMDNIPKRARYYQSMIDVELIERGAMYKNLNPELGALLDYMIGRVPSSELTNKIDERVAQLKRNERWKGEFMTLYEHCQIEREEGIRLGLAQAVDTLMSSMNLSLEDACKALKITVEEYERTKTAQ